MQSVGNLTDFVRCHMLEPFPVERRIQALIGHFDDLTCAHPAILKAKDQIDRLRPLVADCDRYQTLEAEAARLRRACEALEIHFAAIKRDLLDKRLEKLTAEREKKRLARQRLDEERCQLPARRDELRQAIAEHGGDRHEKDDRHCIDDRCHYVLGWSNAAKIAALERERADLEVRMQRHADTIADLERQRQELEAASNLLRTLQGQLDELEETLGQDESARYGLELFRRLGLQLLIVTPLQKIHVIEPFVAAVGYVFNRNGRQSLLRQLTIEEYRAEREAHRENGGN